MAADTKIDFMETQQSLYRISNVTTNVFTESDDTYIFINKPSKFAYLHLFLANATKNALHLQPQTLLYSGKLDNYNGNFVYANFKCQVLFFYRNTSGGPSYYTSYPVTIILTNVNSNQIIEIYCTYSENLACDTNQVAYSLFIDLAFPIDILE